MLTSCVAQYTNEIHDCVYSNAPENISKTDLRPAAVSAPGKPSNDKRRDSHLLWPLSMVRYSEYLALTTTTSTAVIIITIPYIFLIRDKAIPIPIDHPTTGTTHTINPPPPTKKQPEMLAPLFVNRHMINLPQFRTCPGNSLHCLMVVQLSLRLPESLPDARTAEHL